MLPINLGSFYQAYRSLQKDQFQRYLQVFGIELKDQEREDLSFLIETLLSEGEYSDFQDFYIGYKIPQISKEFDLLRLGENYHIDIEIKHESTPKKISKQLQENRHYLKATAEHTFVFSFVVSTQMVYTLDQDGQLVETTLEEVRRRLRKQRVRKVIDPEFRK